MNSPIGFTPAGSVTLQTACSPVPGTFAMPAVDDGNVDLRISADGATTAYVSFAGGAPVGSDVPGALIVKPGQSALLTAQPALLARPGKALAEFNALMGNYTPPGWVASVAAAAATATACTVITNPPGGVITITRGTATGHVTF